ncbi:hypothetical protein TGAM01_v201912 [Trichoderma gamsii]|uniref:Transcription factor domain-containing protein n=1 Tax=Trichoderma gamsii TaxID=398673 RepID=A0A2P4ZWY4_9HYPO|nr:hypothetical protein TGAM01_v201912 [Trichoderma gamsii]PON28804.1 hypothetical protein TGAM01_v201912 [Trichoderma gamsii]
MDISTNFGWRANDNRQSSYGVRRNIVSLIRRFFPFHHVLPRHVRDLWLVVPTPGAIFFINPSSPLRDHDSFRPIFADANLLSLEAKRFWYSIVASKPLSELTLVGGEDKLSHIRSRWINPLFRPPNRTVSVNEASARFMTQVLKCYPKMMARDGTLPPIIHRLQTTSRTTPTPLVDCLAWTKMWEHRTGNLDAMLLNAMRGEVERLYKNHRSYEQVDLLAALQASLIYSIMICLDSNTTAKYGTQLVLGQLQEMTYRLLSMTEFPRADISSKVPDRELWAIASAAQRTVLAIYVFDCVVCFLNRIPVYSCDELDFIPAPVCRRLWEAREYETWREEYGNWFKVWKGREVLMGELLIQLTESYASKRVEEWLSEADEFGMLIFTGSLLSVNSK